MEGKQNQSVYLLQLLTKIINSFFPFFNNFEENNTLRWSAKDINKIKLPFSTTGGKNWLYYSFNQNLHVSPKWKENTSDKVKVRFVTCYSFAWLAGN